MEVKEHLKNSHNEVITKYTGDPDSFDFDKDDHENVVYFFADLDFTIVKLIFVCNLWIMGSWSVSLY